MKILSSVLLWRGLLLSQYALALFYAIGTGRIIAYQLRNDGFYPMGCFPISLTESYFQIAISVFALVSIISLFTRRLWARILYGLWTVLLSYILADTLISEWPDLWQGYLLIPTAFVTVSAFTLGVSFLPWNGPRNTPSKEFEQQPLSF